VNAEDGLRTILLRRWRADDKAFFPQSSGYCESRCDFDEVFTIVDRMREATEQRIEGNPGVAVKSLPNHLPSKEERAVAILQHSFRAVT